MLPIRPSALACPSAKTLLSYHRDRLSPRKKKNVSAHISRCSECARKTEYILSVMRDEQQLIQGIEAFLPENKRRPLGTPIGLSGDSGLWALRAIQSAAALVFFLILTLAPPGRGLPGRAHFVASGSIDRLSSAFAPSPGLLPGLMVIKPRYEVPETEEALAGRYGSGEVSGSFRLRARSEISGSRLGEAGFYGWSLAITTAASIPWQEGFEGRSRPRLWD